MSHTRTLCCGLVVVMLGAFAIAGRAQQAPAAPPPITMKMLKPDVWAGIGGAGGNSTIIIGKTGVGKSWLACALGHKACRDDRSVSYQRVPRLFDALALARGDGRHARLLNSRRTPDPRRLGAYHADKRTGARSVGDRR